MIVDTSVLVAILRLEPETSRLARVLASQCRAKLPACCYLEASMVLLGLKGESGYLELDQLLANTGLQIVPFTPSQARLAREAFRRYGKGRHPAGLNFGDCMS